MKTFFKKLLSVLFGLLIALTLCEIILHIYNPFPFAVSSGKFVLPANQKTVFKNTWIKKLDSNIYYSRNSLGFRGPEPADSISKLNALICIGGSTTECHYISDSLTWPYQLGTQLKDSLPGLWLNNAGLDGHSTFGHLLLLKEYIIKLRPKYVLFLTGVNDVETSKPELYDLMNERSINFASVKSFFKSLANKTELGSTIFQLYAIRGAYKKGLIHKDVDFTALQDTILPQAYTNERLKNQQVFLSGYKQRLAEMIAVCKSNNIIPILLTQPSMFGTYTDSATMINMTNKVIPGGEPLATAALMGTVLELYNNVVRSFGNEVKVIDLAARMPKNSDYFYDFAHYTNTGCSKVSSIIAVELIPYLKATAK
ncbi:MAG: SGNH/GDSL hydrolase family protein [Ferruginibacter sp.]